jgi:hypothetical protein
LAFKAAAAQRRLETAQAAKQQRKADRVMLDAVIAKAEAAIARARAAERAAVARAQRIEDATAPDTPGAATEGDSAE